MHLTLNISAPDGEDSDDRLLLLDIPPDATVAILKASVHAETQITTTSQHLYHNGRLLSDDTQTMEQLGIGDGEMLALHVRDVVGYTGVPAEASPAPRHGPPDAVDPDPEMLRLQILGNPAMRQQVLAQRPDLGRALNSPQQFAQLFRQMRQAESDEQLRRRQQIAALNDDPFDPEAQMRIAEMIREERVQENLQNAIEHNPEVFGRVHMLYIDCEVNGHKVKAFVDSGAQATIMSPACAEACGIMRLVDKRFSGIARGVGTANILGRVHSAQIRIGSMFLACSFTVMEGKDVDLLLGLDMLKRHQACIDLARDRLIIQGVEVPFLGEADIPKMMEDARVDEPTVTGPGGTTIGARSGAVSMPQQPVSRAGPSGGPPAHPAPPSRPAAAAPSISREKVEQLMAMGVPQAEAEHTLAACDGDVNLAASILFPQ